MMKREIAQRLVRIGFWACAFGMAALLLTEPPALQGQTAPPPRSLQIVILDGEGALNNIQARTAREPIVQVQDENHKPVAGAVVLFTVHGGTSGAGGTFANGASQLSVTTGPDGTAAAHGLALNQNEGAWQIDVTATEGTLTAGEVINEISFAPLSPPQQGQEAEGITAFHPHWFLTKPVMLIGGAIVIGGIITWVVVNPPATTGTLIVPGGSTVGPPGSSPGIRFRIGR